jgi:hypothetical protein
MLAMDPARHLAGAPMLDASGGFAPDLTPHTTGLGDWAEDEIVRLLTLGLKPDFDSIGGAMGPVVANLAKLPPSDIDAIVAYLKSLPPLPETARPPAPAPPSPR